MCKIAVETLKFQVTVFNLIEQVQKHVYIQVETQYVNKGKLWLKKSCFS